MGAIFSGRLAALWPRCPTPGLLPGPASASLPGDPGLSVAEDGDDDDSDAGAASTAARKRLGLGRASVP